MAEDHRVDIGLSELLRLDLVLLRGTEQIVEERHVELQHLDELDHPAVRDVELAVEVEGARVGLAPEFGDLAVIDVTRQLGAVLVLLILRLKGANADPVLFREEEASHDDALHDLRPVAVTLFETFLEDKASQRTDFTDDLDGELFVAVAPLVQRLADLIAIGVRNQLQRLTVHRIPRDAAVLFFPAE